MPSKCPAHPAHSSLGLILTLWLIPTTGCTTSVQIADWRGPQLLSSIAGQGQPIWKGATGGAWGNAPKNMSLTTQYTVCIFHKYLNEKAQSHYLETMDKGALCSMLQSLYTKARSKSRQHYSSHRSLISTARSTATSTNLLIATPATSPRIQNCAPLT